jgi:acylphosphatase
MGGVRRLLRISGRVQGVGYRAFVQEQAMRLGLGGWVRNRRDGSVESLIAGEDAAVDTLTALLRKGPPGARVSGIDASEAAPDALRGPEDRFYILPTM